MKKLKCIFIILWSIILIFSPCISSNTDLNFGKTDGCQHEFNEEECVVDYYCVSYVTDIIEWALIESSKYSNCKHTIYWYKDYYVPLHLHYRGIGGSQAVPNLSVREYFQGLLLYLDLAFNNYDNVPLIYEMKRLESLNVSHNNIKTAKLYNYYNLESLVEIDFSYNEIDTIDSTHNELYNSYKLKKLWLSHNQLINLPEVAFNNLSDLEYLDLSYNLITAITLATFEGLKKLQILKLSHNKIIDLNYSLFRFNNLRELYLNNNNIESILVRDFEKLSNLEILDLGKNFIHTLEANVFSNLTLLKEIDLSENLLTTIDKAAFSAIVDIKSINLSKNKLTEIPIHLFQTKNISFFSIEENNLQGSLKRGIFEGLQLITKLDMSYQSITSIEDYAFFGLDNLVELLLNNNKIQSLSNKSFKILRRLVHLDLSFNQITQIEFDKEDLLSLRSLIFHNNYITQIKKDNLENLQVLQFLDVSKNNISKIEIKSFKTLVNVNNLLLSKNPLSGNIETNTFEGLSLVPELDLSFTFLSIIMNASFGGMTNLNNLNISHSKVNELQYNTFSNTGNIEVLDLSYNMITNFTVNVMDLKNLKQLFLNNNHITALYSNIFKGMSLLSKIMLSNNFIVSVDKDIFKDQTNLRYLDLSINSNMKLNFLNVKEIKLLETLVLSSSIPNITFEDFDEVSLSKLEITNSNIQNISKLHLNNLKKVQFLHLSNNNVKQLDVGTFSNMDEIVEIDVSYNKIDIIQPGVFKDNHLLNKLNVSHNALLAISYGVLRGLVNLRVLDISFNYINSLETERFYEVPDLQELIADHNRITDVSVEDFRGTNIKKLSIGDNPLSCEKVTRLKKESNPLFVITALRHVEEKEENIYGISCNNHRHESSFNRHINDKQNKNDNNEKILIEIRDILLNLNAGMIESEKRVIQNDNLLNFTEVVQRLLLESISQRLEMVNATSTLLTHKNEKIILNNVSKSSVFMETCVAFILLILVCIILYKLYESKFYVPRRNSITINPISNAMDTSNI